VEDFIRFGYTVCWIEGGSNIATRGKKFCGLNDEWDLLRGRLFGMGFGSLLEVQMSKCVHL
jgi:hypothetical protein